MFGIDDPVDTPVVAIQTLETTFTELPIEIEWEGITNSREFVYELQYTDDPSIVHSWNELDTTNATSVAFDNLDEGNYTFSVFGLYNQDVIGNVENFSFAVDAIQGPALRIYPLYQSANTGDEIDVNLYFEDVLISSAVTGLQVDIQINSDELEFVTDNFEYGELITSFPGTAIYPNPIYSENGASLSIMGVADSSGTGIYGTGSIAKFRLKVLFSSGTHDINIYQGENAFQNINGDWYGFNDPVSGNITVVGADQ